MGKNDQAVVNTAAAISAKVSGEPTAEQIEQWKKQHGEVHLIEVDDKKAYLRKPNRKDLAHAQTLGRKDNLKFNQAILDNCWLAGDPEIKTDDDYFLGACGVLDELIQFKQASIKKL